MTTNLNDPALFTLSLSATQIEFAADERRDSLTKQGPAPFELVLDGLAVHVTYERSKGVYRALSANVTGPAFMTYFRHPDGMVGRPATLSKATLQIRPDKTESLSLHFGDELLIVWTVLDDAMALLLDQVAAKGAFAGVMTIEVDTFSDVRKKAMLNQITVMDEKDTAVTGAVVHFDLKRSLAD